MSMWKKPILITGYLYYFIDKKNKNHFNKKVYRILFFILGILFIISTTCGAEDIGQKEVNFPIEMKELISSLNRARSSKTDQSLSSYPHGIKYTYVIYDMNNDKLKKEKRSVTIKKKPKQIIPQSVGITEILWSMCPHDRIIAYHEACKKSEFCFIADKIPSTAPFFGTQDAEIVIGYNPDLVLTTYYTSSEFKERLDSASLQYVETGYFGDIDSIERQILLIGKLIGEKSNAKLLIRRMKKHIETINKFIKKHKKNEKTSVIYYDERGYVAGLHTNFNSICNILDLENSASIHGIKYFKQIEYEQVLKWDPDIIIVPEESNLEKTLYSEKVLQTAKAIKNKNIKKIPSVYLLASSQYIVASVNFLAGLIYAK